MLDPDDGDAARPDVANGRDQRRAFAVRQSARDLIEQQDTRLRRKRSREFETFALEERERARATVRQRQQPRSFQNLLAVRPDVCLAAIVAMGRPDEQILVDGEIAERVWHLERPCDARPRPGVSRLGGDVLALQPDGAAVRLERSGDQIEGRGLAGAIRTDDAERRVSFHGDIELVGHNHRAERLRQLVQFENHAPRSPHARQDTPFPAPSKGCGDACLRLPASSFTQPAIRRSLPSFRRSECRGSSSYRRSPDRTCRCPAGATDRRPAGSW